MFLLIALEILVSFPARQNQISGCIRMLIYLYQYIVVYVDDLEIAAKYPEEIINILNNKFNLSLKVPE